MIIIIYCNCVYIFAFKNKLNCRGVNDCDIYFYRFKMEFNLFVEPYLKLSLLNTIVTVSKFICFTSVFLHS